jgi:hypothetical protein
MHNGVNPLFIDKNILNSGFRRLKNCQYIHRYKKANVGTNIVPNYVTNITIVILSGMYSTLSNVSHYTLSVCNEYFKFIYNHK